MAVAVQSSLLADPATCTRWPCCFSQMETSMQDQSLPVQRHRFLSRGHSVFVLYGPKQHLYGLDCMAVPSNHREWKRNKLVRSAYDRPANLPLTCLPEEREKETEKEREKEEEKSQSRRCECMNLFDQLVPYTEAWRWQRNVVDSKIAARRSGQTCADTVILLQHSPVYTMGAASSEQYLKFDKEDPRFELHRTERGGEVTYHGPGQLVMYPIIDLREHKMDIHWYLRSLEEVVIRALWKGCGIKAYREDGLTGVWARGCKLAAIGVRVSRWVTYHGLALNVTTDLSAFSRIVPCGITDRQVSSVACLLGKMKVEREIGEMEMKMGEMGKQPCRSIGFDDRQLASLTTFPTLPFSQAHLSSSEQRSDFETETHSPEANGVEQRNQVLVNHEHSRDVSKTSQKSEDGVREGGKEDYSMLVGHSTTERRQEEWKSGPYQLASMNDEADQWREREAQGELQSRRIRDENHCHNDEELLALVHRHMLHEFADVFGLQLVFPPENDSFLSHL